MCRSCRPTLLACIGACFLRQIFHNLLSVPFGHPLHCISVVLQRFQIDVSLKERVLAFDSDFATFLKGLIVLSSG